MAETGTNSGETNGVETDAVSDHASGAGPGTRPDNKAILWAIGALGGALVAGAAIFIWLVWQGHVELGAGLSSVVLLVAGFVTVTLLMLTGTLVLAVLGMRAPGQALGMPAGSIRALIAMVLILIFAIIGIVVFNAGTSPELYKSTGLTQAQVDALRANGAIILQQNVEPTPTPPPPSPAPSPAPPPTPIPTPAPPLYTVTTRASMTPDSHDFGLQLLTTVSTLVVAVAGFYFGSKATEQAIGAVKASSPEPRPAPDKAKAEEAAKAKKAVEAEEAATAEEEAKAEEAAEAEEAGNADDDADGDANDDGAAKDDH